MERDMKFKLTYHESGFIEIGKFIEEERNTYTKEETKDILNKLLDLLVRGDFAHKWGFSFQAIGKNNQMWIVERKAVDREEHTFTVAYLQAWNIMDAPRRMKRSELIKDIMGGRKNA